VKCIILVHKPHVLNFPEAERSHQPNKQSQLSCIPQNKQPGEGGPDDSPEDWTCYPGGKNPRGVDDKDSPFDGDRVTLSDLVPATASLKNKIILMLSGCINQMKRSLLSLAFEMPTHCCQLSGRKLVQDELS
jgi:hypothetical protein